MRKCTALEPVEGEAYETKNECGEDAIWLCMDMYGRFIIPRCDIHGAAFMNKKPIEKEENA